MVNIQTRSPISKEEKLKKQIEELNDDENFLNKLLIRKEMKWREIFKNIMLIVVFVDVFGNAYFASFEPPDDYRFIIID